MQQAQLRRYADPEAHRSPGQDHREKIRNSLMGHAVSPESREKMRQAALNRSPETRERMREAQLRRHADDPELREKMRQALQRPETREKMRQARLGKRVTVETRERLRQAATKANRTPDAREKQRRSRLGWCPVKMTDIERALHDEFKRRGLDFIMHLPMWGRFQPDFLFEDCRPPLIVQADGGWIHKRPKERARDAALEETARAEGWTVLRFSDKQIKASAAACGRAVAAFVRQHTP